MRILLWGMAVLALACGPSVAAAEDCAAPCIGYTITGDIQDDFVLKSDAAGRRYNDLNPVIDADIFVAPIDHLKLFGSITHEPVLDRPPGALPRLSDFGLYTTQLYAEIEFEPLKWRIGKFDPVFGLATGELTGLHATDLVGNYDLNERLGGEMSVTFEALGLSQAMTASLFTMDRTRLGGALLAGRGLTTLASGGVGNTHGLSSFALALDGCAGAEAANCYSEGDFGYRLAVRHQGAGLATEDQIDAGLVPHDETGFLAAATARFGLSEDTTLRLLGEAAYFRNFEGGADDALTGTLSAALERGPMTYAATYSLQENLIAGAPDTLEHQLDLTATYDFGEEASFAGEQWSLSGGYSYSLNADNEESHAVGLRLTVELDGKIGGPAEPPSSGNSAPAAGEPETATAGEPDEGGPDEGGVE